MRGTLKHRRQFQRVYAEGAKAVGHLLVAFALSDPSEESAVGIVASRKVGKAVQRNRAKRRLRAAYAEIRDRLPSGTWLVLVARASLAESGVQHDHVRVDLERQLEHLRLLVDHRPDTAGES